MFRLLKGIMSEREVMRYSEKNLPSYEKIVRVAFKISVGEITDVKYYLMLAGLFLGVISSAPDRRTIPRKTSWERRSVPLLSKIVSPSSRDDTAEGECGKETPEPDVVSTKKRERWRVRWVKCHRRIRGWSWESFEIRAYSDSVSPATHTREYNFFGIYGGVYSPWTLRRSRRPAPRDIPR